MIGSKSVNFFRTLEIFTIVLLTFSPLIPRVLSIVLLFFLIAVSLIDLIRTNVNITLDNTLLIALICFALAMIFDIRNTLDGQPYSLVNFMYPCYFICGYFVAKRYSRDEFYDKVEKIAFMFALLSLVGMSVFFINSSWIYSFPTYSYNGATHRTIFFFNYLFSGDWMAVRNSGMAWEPGAFQILLNIAFQIAIQKYTGKKLFFRVLIYCIAIVLTRSTIGYVILAINLFALLCKHKKYIPLTVIVGLLGTAFIIPELMYQIEYKLFGSSAFGARFEPLINALSYAWYMPFGLGSTGYDAIYEAEHLGSYDCYTQMLLRFGYPIIIYVFGRLFKIFRKDSKYIALILVISFLSEPIWGSIMITAMYYLGDEKTLEVRE